MKSEEKLRKRVKGESKKKNKLTIEYIENSNGFFCVCVCVHRRR